MSENLIEVVQFFCIPVYP